jgi:cyclic pyranopterin phosphate synthase
MPLSDAHGRTISDLRVSVTDRCNFRCRYCMPAEGMPWIPREEILSFEEIERLVRLLVDLGVTDVRLTGGEPLVRRGFPTLVGMLRGIEGIEDLSLTTNAYLLAAQAADLVAAGIDRVNVSIDSLARARFFEVTRRDALDRVMEGLEAIAAFPQVSPVKVNAVPIPGFGREDVLRFCALARERGFQVRFIEFMPLDGDRAWRAEEVLTGATVRAMIEEVHPLVERPREPHATARVYGFADGRGEIGFVNPVSEPFCADCDRLRLTADGKLRTCLFSLHETDLRGPLRSGASEEELGRIVREAVWRKELKHRIDEPGFRPPARTMSAIGG